MFNVGMHKITKHCTVQLGNLMNREFWLLRARRNHSKCLNNVTPFASASVRTPKITCQVKKTDSSSSYRARLLSYNTTTLPTRLVSESDEYCFGFQSLMLQICNLLTS